MLREGSSLQPLAHLVGGDAALLAGAGAGRGRGRAGQGPHTHVEPPRRRFPPAFADMEQDLGSTAGKREVQPLW